LRFLAVTIAALALTVAASAVQAPVAKKKTATAGAKAKVVPHVAVSAKTGIAKSSASRSVASKSAASKSAASKSGSKAASKTAASKTGVRSRRAVVARRPPTQQQPTTDRYKEIQQALADKGYFQGPVDGAWNAGSVEALKRFQKDQNLDPDGKIGSLSLIALGLGPKRSVASAQPSPAGSESIDPPPVAQPQQ
jgi:peptidoglycan hydrolase-like protein with peptidoglycan-binding domain